MILINTVRSVRVFLASVNSAYIQHGFAEPDELGLAYKLLKQNYAAERGGKRFDDARPGEILPLSASACLQEMHAIWVLARTPDWQERLRAAR
ncbi:MAG: hypothetical protein A3J48_01150 [Candidatus Doudnabacteria bacterium RIFCSPHIGHO2_02_FULL_46_11]|uniref:Uncharacterized protein n=1 Tax=Candidatus Doudnabacteria bacterium RIFCSPHIGHO2_02_FULL_46_11 TaxID=1817832 RepID=A0A1F5P8L0_9BACT|nr:MAG: hypothetical protein A3J48_01150 [Candidatus Doudnabacteria bacterium RIFCSPHIGHO2_02_FULL_46_11]